MDSKQSKANSQSQTESRAHIAILEADPAILRFLHSTLSDRYKVSLFDNAADLMQCVSESPRPDLLLMDWHFNEDNPEEGALRLLVKARMSHPKLQVVMLACSAELNDVFLAIRMGAADVILKPFKTEEIRGIAEQYTQAPEQKSEQADTQEIALDENTSFVRSSKRMKQIESQCALVARADIPVLILGESGTGKEVAAMLVHKLSSRSQRSFLKVNCAAMPADLLESELFGYEQGAFTGAIKSKPGKFEICNHGTIFLDEIGEMPSALQAKLLQVLQDGSFARLGSRTSVKVDVRVIAATNIDIKTAMVQKTFREDLYYRLNGFTVKLPPLRERTDEIPTLAAHFMKKVAAKYSADPLPISPTLMQALTSHSWPGNLRELENVIKRYMVLRDEQEIINELMPQHGFGSDQAAADGMGANGGLKFLVRNLKGGAESATIAQTLEKTGWNRKSAANDLQISYKALLYKIKQYNLTPPNKYQHAEQIQRTSV